MRIFMEDELLDKGFRAKVIEEIEAPENLERKEEMKRRYDVFKDNTKRYVLDRMQGESTDTKIVNEIIHRTANASFTRKIIDKKAMVYKDGVIRTIQEDNEKVRDETQEQIDKQVDLVNMNSKMVKINKYTELFKNSVAQIIPFKHQLEKGKMGYKIRTLQPYFYDVIEDRENPEEARAYIFSYYNPELQTPEHAPENQSGEREFESITPNQAFRRGDERDQTIADAPDDFQAQKREYVWWSNKYHFTTDEKGEIIEGKQEKDLLNPIEQLPFYNFSEDQDGQFWALGGEDIVDTGILLNVLLTDLFYIAKYQGMGIGYFWGKGVPKNIKVGASAFLTLDMDKEDPTPQMGFATSNPPISAHLEMIDKYLEYVLETNGLRAKGTTGGASASGVHEMIIMSDNTQDLESQRETYRDGEPMVFRIMAKWHNLLLDRDVLASEYADLGKINEDLIVKIKFPDPQPFVTEKEKLENIEKRLAIGLDSMMDAIKKDNPDLGDTEAEAKLKKILEEKLEENSRKLKEFAQGGFNAMQQEEEGEEEEEKEE
jgi:hypothetical protein